MDITLLILKVSSAAIGFVASILIIKKYFAEPVFKRFFGTKKYKTIQAVFVIGVHAILYYFIRVHIFLLGNVFKGAILDLVIVLMLGSCLMILSIFLLRKLGAYKFEKNEKNKDFIGNLIQAFAFFLLLAMFEEILIRGIVYIGLRKQIGMFTTMIITIIIFVVPHLRNKGINVFSIASLILAGVLLNLLTEYSGNIWMPLGFHFSWNYIQGIIGFNVSGGNEMKSIYYVIKQKNDYLNGGEFGIEASLVTIILLFICILVIIIILV